MSGFKVSKSSPDILSKSSPDGIVPTKDTETSSVSDAPKLSPEQSQKKFTPPSPPEMKGKTQTLDLDETLSRVDQKLSDSSSQDLRTTQRMVPSPEDLAKTREKIMGKALESGSYQPQTETVDKTLTAAKAEYLKDTELLSENIDESVGLTASSFFDEEVSETSRDFVKQLQVFAPSGRTEDRVKDYFREQMGKELKVLSKVDRSRYSSDEKKQEALKKSIDGSSRRLRGILKGFSTQQELSILLKTRSDLELRSIFAEIVGETRHGKAMSYDKLSPKKQAFVDEMVKATRRGLNDQVESPQPYFPGLDDSALTKAAGDLGHAFRNRVHQLSDSQLQKLSIMSNEQLKEMLISEIGHSDAVLDIAITSIRMEVDRAMQALDSTPRTAPKVVERFKAEMLINESVQGKLDSLKTDLSNPEKQGEFIGAMKDLVKSMPATHNAKWHLSRLTLQDTAKLLQSYAPGLEDEAALEMAKELKTALPISYGEALHTETVFSQTMGNVEVKIPKEITVDGTTYKMDKRLAVAGNGAVYRYFNPENPTERVAVKINVGSMDREGILKEVDLHRELMGPTGSSDKVGQLKGVSTLEDGSLIMVQDYLSGGDLASPRDHFRRAVDEGLIRPETADLLNLYMLKGAFEALDYMHSEREMIHLDMKLQNMMLGSDGKVKLIDFGTSHMGTEVTTDVRMVDSPFNLAPERMSDGMKRKTKESDVWSGGVMAYELLIGSFFEHDMMSSRFGFKNEDAVKDFAMDPESRVTTSGKMDVDGVSKQGLGVTAKQKLVNSLMMGQSDQRVTLKTALKSSLLTDSTLTHPKMVALFQKLSTVPPVDEPATDLDKTKALIVHITPELKALGLS